MKNSVLHIFFISFMCFACIGCQKKEKLYYNPVISLDNVSIIDITPIDAEKFLVLGADEDDHSVVYLCTKKTDGTYSKTKRSSSKVHFHTIEFSNGTTWLGGDTLAIRTSADTGRNWTKYGDFSFWKENWPSEISDLRKLYIKNDAPYYAIGTDDLLSGNFYWTNADWGAWASTQLKFGTNSMVVYNDSAYVAGYGSILFATEAGKTQSLEDIGGENYTDITIANAKYVYVCTYSGNIYRSELFSHSWEKMFDEGKQLLHIAADDFGNVVALGESKTILISNDNGENWREESYSEGNKISCIEMIQNEFYIGTEKGTIIKLNNTSLEEE